MTLKGRLKDLIMNHDTFVFWSLVIVVSILYALFLDDAPFLKDIFHYAEEHGFVWIYYVPFYVSVLGGGFIFMFKCYEHYISDFFD